MAIMIVGGGTIIADVKRAAQKSGNAELKCIAVALAQSGPVRALAFTTVAPNTASMRKRR
jgi:hypothetical protein